MVMISIPLAIVDHKHSPRVWAHTKRKRKKNEKNPHPRYQEMIVIQRLVLDKAILPRNDLSAHVENRQYAYCIVQRFNRFVLH